MKLELLDKEAFNELVKTKFDNRVNGPLVKTFKFTPESLQDDPERVFKEVQEYVDETMFRHRDKIEDFNFELSVDNETFSTIVQLRMDVYFNICS